jgi:hypothetical protein
VAGDLMPGATEDQRVATGFLRNAMLNEEGGADPEQFRIDGLIDRMDCLGKAVLGVTIQCAQCHNHKFDPVSQEEYYRLFAFLNNDHESSVVAYTPSEQQLRDTLARQMREVDEGLRHVTPGWEETLAGWEESVRNDQPEWSVVRCNYDGENGERFYYYEDGSIRAASYAPTLWAAHFHGTNTLSSIAEPPVGSDSTMTGGRPLAARRRQADSPSSPGIIRSSTTRSAPACSSLRSMSAASDAVAASNPDRSNTCCSPCRMAGSSSTISTRGRARSGAVMRFIGLLCRITFSSVLQS